MAMQIQYSQDKQNYSAVGPEAGRLHSQSFKEVTLCVGEESVTIPVQVCTRVSELREVLACQLGYIDGNELSFVVKAGCSWKKLQESDQVLSRMYVKGIASLKPGRHKYPHPYGIIGTGYLGMKTAMFLTHYGSGQDYVMFDRYDRVGGHCWLEMANKTTRLQTEFPTFHVWFGPEWSYEGSPVCGGAPIKHEIWPSRDKLLAHFQLCAEEFGILPHVHFRTNVEKMDVIGKPTDRGRHYSLWSVPVQYERKDVQGGGALAHQLGGEDDLHQSAGVRVNDREPFVTAVSCLCMWPGALVYPRPVVYRGEELFGGQIDYAVEMRFDYAHVVGKVVTIHGHGAFTMENIRTCLEFTAKKMYVLCRKINLTCPRPASWFVNQANPPISAAQMLNMLSHAYLAHCRIDGQPVDPWTIHSVHGKADRTHATIMQKTRFGIGDVYFLSQAYGLMKLVIGNVKRCTHHCLHLDNGEKLECECVLKCTGCLGDWKVDKLLQIKEMRGMYVNGDFRRACTGEADGINAAQFSATTAGPGYYSMVRDMLHFWDTPNDWHRLMDLGIVDSLPVHRAGEPNEEFPAYFFTAAHAQGAGILISAASPLLGAKGANDGIYKNYVQTTCIPIERIIADSKADWEDYERKIREKGMVPADTPYVPYLYTEEYLREQLILHQKYAERRYGGGG